MAILRKCGFITSSLRASMKSSEREAVIADWNDTTSKTNVLILNSSVSSAGLNCHHQCHVGVGVGFVWNAAVIHQFIGRLPRIGQLHPVEWDLVWISDTVSPWQEDRMLRKVRALWFFLDICRQGEVFRCSS